jgi:hypothetical protein
MSPPTAQGLIAPWVAMTLPTVAPLPSWQSGMTATPAHQQRRARGSTIMPPSRPLHAIDFLGLAVDRHVAADHADAALLRQRNDEARSRVRNLVASYGRFPGAFPYLQNPDREWRRRHRHDDTAAGEHAEGDTAELRAGEDDADVAIERRPGSHPCEQPGRARR